jgi:hypothetical protein
MYQKLKDDSKAIKNLKVVNAKEVHFVKGEFLFLSNLKI